MEYLSAEDLDEIEKRIPYPFPESFRNWIVGSYVKGARNYLSYSKEDDGYYYRQVHALLNFEALDENWAFKEFNSIVAENLELNHAGDRRRIPNGVIISRTKWGDPGACLYFFLNENNQIGDELYLSIEEGTPRLELDICDINTPELISISAVEPDIISLLEEKIGAKLPDEFKNMLFTAQFIPFNSSAYCFPSYLQELKTEADIDKYIRRCLYVKNGLKMEDFPLLVMPNGMGDEMLMLIRDGEVIRQWFELDHEQAIIKEAFDDWMF